MKKKEHDILLLAAILAGSILAGFLLAQFWGPYFAQINIPQLLL